MIFTTSWDDGYALDIKLATLLNKYDIKGTFYVCPKSQYAEKMLTSNQIKDLSNHHEIGAHSMTHPRLSNVPLEQAKKEIMESKHWIETCTGKACTMFCYPKGDFNDNIAKAVKEAGYKGARTVEQLDFTIGTDPYRMPTTLHIYPFPWRRKFTRWWHFFDPAVRLRMQWKQLREIGVPLTAMRSWSNLAIWLFGDAITKKKPIFHLWGHSEEVERYGMWKDLEKFLAHVQKHSDKLEFVTNTQLLP